MDVAWRMEMLLFYAWRIRWDAAGVAGIAGYSR
jgi:hypothetical protein